MTTISTAFEEDNGSGIAVIGMAGRFPGARNVAEFWRNLCGGVESISFFSEEEMIAAGIPAARVRGRDYVGARGVLEDIEMFDAAFFRITRREAEITDPQHRVFMECAWEALEDAGYHPEKYDGLVGVYAGACHSTYLIINVYSNREAVEAAGAFQIDIRNDADHLPAHVSYRLNLRGPSVAIQTACSTSLVAVHQACSSLLSGDCDMALAGGAGIAVPQQIGYLYKEGGIMSPDGHCRPFDAKAGGTVGGNGVGIVVLKRLEDALADGDHIRAVIRGSAINNDGSDKVGYTAPSVSGQARVIAMAHGVAGVGPETITYVEAHGTGTAIGDPIEVAALTQAFRAGTEAEGFCAIGSVKSNVGHLDAAAGVAGLIKTVLALEHKLLPPSLHFEEPNPQVAFAGSPFFVNARPTEWESNGSPRRAGVSSFGIGGTNAHVVLEEAPAPPAPGASRRRQLLTLSARTDSALEAATANLLAHLRLHPDQPLADVAYTLQLGRGEFAARRALVCRDRADAVRALEAGEYLTAGSALRSAKPLPVHFMFPGQGAQRVNMGRGLYEGEPAFRAEVDRCCEYLRPLLGCDLRGLLYPRAEEAEAAALKLKQTRFAQPALFVTSYALAALWAEWGVRPRAMLGHSVGEYVAACLAGVFSLEDALRLIAARGRLMQGLPEGAMLAVPLPEHEAGAWLGPRVSLAAVNAPSACVLSGDPEAIAEVERRLAGRGLDCRRLHTSHAFHSHMMEPVLAPFAEAFRGVALSPPQRPYLSNVTGTWAGEEAATPGYWVEHLRRPVRFASCVAELLGEPGCVLLEVGHGRTLGALAMQQQEAGGGAARPKVVSPSRTSSGDEGEEVGNMLSALGELWAAGVGVDWKGFYRHERRRRVPLPTYPFERQRHWLDPSGNFVRLIGSTPPEEARQAPAPEAVEDAAQGASPVERLLARQIQLMTRQLELLGADGLAEPEVDDPADSAETIISAETIN
ncbi:MAG TPA: type I polyketide synthase [Pyrinomonadaceae bacterium]|jgi:acyl transferase domain-containing protein|nr:type I polyketide synthase [Pyrinomonadaceae bacterium]